MSPGSIPDWLALVGDSADGFPGLPGWGKRSAVDGARPLRAPRGRPRRAATGTRPSRGGCGGPSAGAGPLAEGRPAAELFLDLATLRIEPDRVGDVAGLRWTGPTGAFEELADYLGDHRLVERAEALAAR